MKEITAAPHVIKASTWPANPKAAFPDDACGVVFFGVLLYWIVGVVHTYGGLPWPIGVLTLALLVFYLATYVALFALLTALSWRRFGAMTLAVVPVSWVGLEIVRAKLRGGFPWGLLG